MAVQMLQASVPADERVQNALRIIERTHGTKRAW